MRPPSPPTLHPARTALATRTALLFRRSLCAWPNLRTVKSGTIIRQPVVIERARDGIEHQGLFTQAPHTLRVQQGAVSMPCEKGPFERPV